MEILKRLVPITLSFLFEIFCVQFLTAHLLKMSRYLFVATLALVAAGL